MRKRLKQTKKREIKPNSSCGKSIKPIEVRWREQIREIPKSTWHIHMTWLTLCIIFFAFAFYEGYVYGR